MVEKEYIERRKALIHQRYSIELGEWVVPVREIDYIPAADVVEVVRCKNCKNRYSHLFCCYFGDEDYCPKGAKMDGGVNDG